MASSQQEIDAYLSNVRSAFADYGSNLSKYQRLGKQNIERDKLKFRLLNYFIKIIVDYFDRGTGYATKNFFDEDEIRDVFQHVNNICNTSHMLDL